MHCKRQRDPLPPPCAVYNKFYKHLNGVWGMDQRFASWPELFFSARALDRSMP